MLILRFFPAANATVDLAVVTFNMHGYNQGFQTIRDLICDKKADIFYYKSIG